MPKSERSRRPRSVWNTAPGVEPEDEALLAEWRKLHPVAPWTGEDGKGGFVGWANRLDERVARRGYLMSPRSEVIPVPQGDMYREMLGLLKDWRFLGLVLVGVVVAALVSPVGFPLLACVIATIAAKRVRGRTRDQIKAELAVRSGTGETAPTGPNNAEPPTPQHL